MLIISVDSFNTAPSRMCIVLPLTTRNRNLPSNYKIDPPEGGVDITSYIQCDHVRTISQDRLDTTMGSLGTVSEATLYQVEWRLKKFMGL